MAQTAAPLADQVPLERPLRYWVLSLPFALRFLLATDTDSLTRVLRVVYRAVSGFRTVGAGAADRCAHRRGAQGPWPD